MKKDTDSADRPVHEITPEALQEFEKLWIQWSLDGSNLDLMEAGGLPEMCGLARRVLPWAERVLSAHPSKP